MIHCGLHNCSINACDVNCDVDIMLLNLTEAACVACVMCVISVDMCHGPGHSPGSGSHDNITTYAPSLGSPTIIFPEE